jgi:hypothetical protein
MRRLTTATALVTASVAATAQIDKQDEVYIEKLADVVGFRQGIELTAKVCAERYKFLADSTSKALMEWQERNRTTIDEIEARWAALIKDAPMVTGEKESELLAWLDNLNQRNEAAIREHFRQMPDQAFFAACSASPTTLSQSGIALETAKRAQLLLIRSLRPTYR